MASMDSMDSIDNSQEKDNSFSLKSESFHVEDPNPLFVKTHKFDVAGDSKLENISANVENGGSAYPMKISKSEFPSSLKLSSSHESSMVKPASLYDVYGDSTTLPIVGSAAISPGGGINRVEVPLTHSEYDYTSSCPVVQFNSLDSDDDNCFEDGFELHAHATSIKDSFDEKIQAWHEESITISEKLIPGTKETFPTSAADGINSRDADDDDDTDESYVDLDDDVDPDEWEQLECKQKKVLFAATIDGASGGAEQRSTKKTIQISTVRRKHVRKRNNNENTESKTQTPPETTPTNSLPMMFCDISLIYGATSNPQETAPGQNCVLS